MIELFLVISLIAVAPGAGFSQQRSNAVKPASVVVAFFDENRLRTRDDGQATLETFRFYLKPIQEIVKRDFPDVEFRILTQGALARLPDGTGLNAQNIQPMLGFVLSAQGRKRRILSGAQSDSDFACAAADYFRRRSPACSK